MALTTLAAMRQYLKQWIKQTANKDVQDPLLNSWINQVYTEIVNVTGCNKARLNFTLIASQQAYPVTAMGTGNDISAVFLRPLRVLYDGLALTEQDYEELEYTGSLDPSAAEGTPLYYTWETGDLELFPTPDAAAVSAGQATLIYAAHPGELTEASGTFHRSFKPQWTECLSWGVLEKLIAALPTNAQTDVSFNLGFISAKYRDLLEKTRLDGYYNPTRTYKLKSRGAKKDATYFNDELGYH